MFARKLRIDCLNAVNTARACPLKWLDNFAMRNFTNDAIFDDTLPVADGILEVGYRVPIDKLQNAMENWFRRKGYLKPEESLRVSDLAPDPSAIE